jgi:hypothetical protein
MPDIKEHPPAPVQEVLEMKGTRIEDAIETIRST